MSLNVISAVVSESKFSVPLNVSNPSLVRYAVTLTTFSGLCTLSMFNDIHPCPASFGDTNVSVEQLLIINEKNIPDIRKIFFIKFPFFD